MSLQKIFDEMELYKEYFSIYVQLLQYTFECGGMRIPKINLPTFEYFKKYYDDERYSLRIPHYKESVLINSSCQLYSNHCIGMGIGDGMAYRYIGYWMGCKYFIDSIDGDYIISSNFNEAIKSLTASPISIYRSKPIKTSRLL